MSTVTERMPTATQERCDDAQKTIQKILISSKITNADAITLLEVIKHDILHRFLLFQGRTE